MKLYVCDGKKCGKQIKEDEVLKIYVAYERTPAEINELLGSAPRGTSFEMMKLKSMVYKSFDVCKGCYNKFKKEFFEKVEDKKPKNKP